ncbi:hypothetical protein FHR81_002330 [Actinoalloteichus hoggarensis]|uniref:Uncharacterized protein n=1 Tax=Actinoalloteichus hoggarensis TaxID=1470176 RepID=A0A221W708_9PSEU|nr:M50 family metallopeptidase [Actinoalloteichus hoggarensis]ASO21359.1 hypothetical protein AHOG_18670 [Actinoalloteichus hoggarensis]MBB5921292.1 hypothetical protein [Actinoalloteichus hoggarensis]
MGTLDVEWRELLEAPLSSELTLVLGTGLLALVLVAQRRLWRVTRNVVTIVHEGGHALVALVTGRTLMSIRLHSDTSGVTVSRGRPTGPGMVFTVLAGYLAAPLLGLAAAAAMVSQRHVLLLWVTVGLLAAMLLLIRNLFGVVSLVLTGAVVFCVSWFAPESIQVAFGYGFSWFLLFGGVRPVMELRVLRRGPGPRDSDPDQLARLAGGTALLWTVVFFLVAIASLAFGGLMLLSSPS